MNSPSRWYSLVSFAVSILDIDSVNDLPENLFYNIERCQETIEGKIKK